MCRGDMNAAAWRANTSIGVAIDRQCTRKLIPNPQIFCDREVATKIEMEARYTKEEGQDVAREAY